MDTEEIIPVYDVTTRRKYMLSGSRVCCVKGKEIYICGQTTPIKASKPIGFASMGLKPIPNEMWINRSKVMWVEKDRVGFTTGLCVPITTEQAKAIK